MVLNKLVRRACIGAAASVLMVPLAQAAKLAVNDEVPLTIVSPGFSYITAQPGVASKLSVATEGYLFCANVGPGSPNIVTLAPGHSRWTMPEAFLSSTSYSGGELRVNRTAGGSLEHSLMCHARGSFGEVIKPYSSFGGYVFRDSYEPKESVQYSNMVNWRPTDGFNWSQPDWTLVPTDSCNFAMTASQSPAVDETTLCSAATGVRPDGSEFGTRARTMWTTTSGTNFIYLARIDARLGPQSAPPNSQFSAGLPQQVQDLPNTVDVEIRDAFDSDYLTASGSYCFLSELPATLNATVCNGASAGGSLPLAVAPTGFLSQKVSLSLAFPEAPAVSLYVVVIRSTTNNFPPIHTPVAAVSVMSAPDVVRHENGDAFVGDKVIFGFPGNGGFPWMTQ